MDELLIITLRQRRNRHKLHWGHSETQTLRMIAERLVLRQPLYTSSQKIPHYEEMMQFNPNPSGLDHKQLVWERRHGHKSPQKVFWGCEFIFHA